MLRELLCVERNSWELSTQPWTLLGRKTMQNLKIIQIIFGAMLKTWEEFVGKH